MPEVEKTPTGRTLPGRAKPKIFISYSRRDMAFADRIEGALRERSFETFIDRNEIYAFEDWWKRIEALISQSDTVVFILSPRSVASTVALKEVTAAASFNKRLAPIVHENVDASTVPEQLLKLNFIFFDDPAAFGVSADRLAQALQTDIAWIRQHTEYGELARQWSEASKPRGLLLRSPKLEVAEHWQISRPLSAPEPTELTTAFIEASRREANSARRRSLYIQTSIYVMMIVIICGLIGWINQLYIKNEWKWLVSVRPFVANKITPHVLSAAQEQNLKTGGAFQECATENNQDLCPQMVVIPAGSFTMGSPPTEKGRSTSEGPQHAVTVKKLAVSKFDITFEEWDTCVTYGGCDPNITDSGWGRGKQPVVNVTFNDAIVYSAWLSGVTGRSYRVLSEAEYEYATRAGTQTAYPWGNDIAIKGHVLANCASCGSTWDNKQTAPVGSFDPNLFGLYDMVGNVFAWTSDCYHADYTGAPTDGSVWLAGGDCQSHEPRGGSWLAAPEMLRSATRVQIRADLRNNGLGIRIGRELIP